MHRYIYICTYVRGLNMIACVRAIMGRSLVSMGAVDWPLGLRICPCSFVASFVVIRGMSGDASGLLWGGVASRQTKSATAKQKRRHEKLALVCPDAFLVCRDAFWFVLAPFLVCHDAFLVCPDAFLFCLDAFPSLSWRLPGLS